MIFLRYSLQAQCVVTGDIRTRTLEQFGLLSLCVRCVVDVSAAVHVVLALLVARSRSGSPWTLVAGSICTLYSEHGPYA